MKKYIDISWQIDLAKGWTARSDEVCVTIIKSHDGGALQISSYHKQVGTINREELLDLTHCDMETQQHFQENTWGDFTGFELAYSDGDTFWRKWWLASGQTLLFLTYNCDLARKDDEKKEIDQMVGSLKAKGRTSYCP